MPNKITLHATPERLIHYSRALALFSEMVWRCGEHGKLTHSYYDSLRKEFDQARIEALKDEILLNVTPQQLNAIVEALAAMLEVTRLCSGFEEHLQLYDDHVHELELIRDEHEG